MTFQNWLTCLSPPALKVSKFSAFLPDFLNGLPPKRTSRQDFWRQQMSEISEKCTNKQTNKAFGFDLLRNLGVVVVHFLLLSTQFLVNDKILFWTLNLCVFPQQNLFLFYLWSFGYFLYLQLLSFVLVSCFSCPCMFPLLYGMFPLSIIYLL